jgi:signal transduction histidine kinase/ActR/RegA family two-component response regulator
MALMQLKVKPSASSPPLAAGKTVRPSSANRPAFFAVSSVVLLGGILANATIQSETRQSWADRSIVHTERVIGDLHNLESRLIEAAASGRGYLLTSDRRYLAPFQSAHDAITGVISQLRVALSDPLEDPSAGPVRMGQVEHLAASALAELDRAVDLQQAGKSADAVSVVRGNAGDDLMADLRGMIATMVADEQGNLDSHLQELQHQEAISVVVSITGAAFAAVLMAVAFALVVRYTGAQHNLQRTLQTEHDIALAADKAKSRFLATASHDLRQPLHAVNLFVSALRRRVSDPEATKLVAGIASAAESMQMMFNSLLDVSKLHAGVVVPNQEDFRLQTVLDRLHSSFVAPAAAKRIGFSVARSAAVLHTDPVLLESILRNLISNAIRYTRRGQVSVLCGDGDEVVHLEVQDTGPGIPAEQMERAFEEFQRLDTAASADERGLGLGLAIVRSLANLLELPVDIQSEVGVGTTFTVTVRRGIATEVPEVQAPKAPPSLTRCRILIVEDDPLVRTALTREITDWGATAMTASNAETALSMAQIERPDLAIIDRNLGQGASGIELLKLLRLRFGHSLAAIIVTGSTDPEALAELRESGAMWTTKPVDPNELRSRIASLLEAIPEKQPTG